MKLVGKIIKDTNIVREAYMEDSNYENNFRDELENLLIKLCKKLEIPVPIWLQKNSKEFGAFRKTFFSNEQFVEDVGFDRFELRLER
jgi:hypothetical protein